MLAHDLERWSSGWTARSREPDPGRDRLRASHARRCAPGTRLSRPSGAPTELIVVRPYDDGPAARLRESGARDDQPARPALEAMRHQVDQPARQRAGERGRSPRRLPRSRLDRFRGFRDRGDPLVAALGPARSSRGNAGGPRNPAGDDARAHPASDASRSEFRLPART